IFAAFFAGVFAQEGRRGGRGATAADAGVTAEKSEKSGDAKAEKSEKSDKKEEKEPVLSVTEHTLTVGGKTIRYKATAGYLAMKDAKGEKTKANLFFVAYTKLPDAGETVDLAK